MRKLKIGIVGLGRVASKTHIPVLRSIENVEVVAGAEINPERADRVKNLFGLESVYCEYSDMCSSEELDGVYVCLPNFLHREACARALERGLHVLCEKPMGISSEEAKELADLARRKNLILMPGYKKRYARNFSRAKKLLESGVLGKVVQVQGTFMTPGPYISWDPKSDWYLEPKWHGVIYDSACHLVDLLLYLVPNQIKRVQTMVHNGFNGYDTPTNCSCVFQMENEVIGDLTIGWRASTDILLLSIHGTAGSLTVSRDYFSYVNPGTDPVDKLKNHLQNFMADCDSLLKKIYDKAKGKDFYAEDLAQARAFSDAISGFQKPPVNAEDAIRVHKFLEHLIS